MADIDVRLKLFRMTRFKLGMFDDTSENLPITFPKSLKQLAVFDDYSMKGRTYKYMEQALLYPFGFGLSYEKWKWSNPTVAAASLKKG